MNVLPSCYLFSDKVHYITLMILFQFVIVLDRYVFAKLHNVFINTWVWMMFYYS